MVSIVTKNIRGNEYMYLVESNRNKNRVVQKTVKYIGKKRPIYKEEFECMKLSHSGSDWILNEKADQLSYQDHEKMKNRSNERKKYLSLLDHVSREKEKERFLSEFIANSNGIEGSTLTIKETYNFLFKDISPKSRKKKELFMATNLLLAWEYLEENMHRLPVEKDLFRLHELVNRNIESDETLGRYKKVQNFIGSELTTSYLFTPEKMKRLLRWIKQAYKKMNEFEVAFQSHAQFETIHPFVDGNGRVGRLLMNWLLGYKGLLPFAVRVSKRAKYISALNSSRRGKIEAICRFCRDEYLSQYVVVN